MSTVFVVKEGQIDVACMLLQHGAGKAFSVATKACVLMNGGANVHGDGEFGLHGQFSGVSSSLMRLTIISMATGL